MVHPDRHMINADVAICLAIQSYYSYGRNELCRLYHGWRRLVAFEEEETDVQPPNLA